MNIPKFTAEESLYSSLNRYIGTAGTVGSWSFQVRAAQAATSLAAEAPTSLSLKDALIAACKGICYLACRGQGGDHNSCLSFCDDACHGRFPNVILA
jgi:hypothetical protein